MDSGFILYLNLLFKHLIFSKSFYFKGMDLLLQQKTTAITIAFFQDFGKSQPKEKQIIPGRRRTGQYKQDGGIQNLSFCPSVLPFKDRFSSVRRI